MVKKGTTRRRQGGSINAEPTEMVWAYITVRSYTLCSLEELNKGCTDPRGTVTMMTEFCTVTPSIWGSSAWNLHHGTLLAPTSYRWLLHFWKIFSLRSSITDTCYHVWKVSVSQDSSLLGCDVISWCTQTMLVYLLLRVIAGYHHPI